MGLPITSVIRVKGIIASLIVGLISIPCGFSTQAAKAAAGIAQESPNIEAGNSDREKTIGYLRRLADPVLEHLASGNLRNSLPQGIPNRQKYAPLEALGRLLAGMAPWLELGPNSSPEGILRQHYIGLAREGIRAAVAPDSPDHMIFEGNSQPVVDAAFLSLALLRAPHQLWEGLPPDVRKQLIVALKATRSTKIPENNWYCFPAVTEAALWKFTGTCDMAPIEKAVMKHKQWYLGDGIYGDGPRFHWDYYNSYVIQPMLIAILGVCRERGHPLGNALPVVLERSKRHAGQLEKLISPEATFPVMGRSSTYRFGAFQDLSLMALLHELPPDLKPGGVRSALTAVIDRMLSHPGTFDSNGWLQPGALGHQPSLRENYISPGSPYLCAVGMLHLGLPPEDPFWKDPSSPWTQKKIWNGDSGIPIDHAMKDSSLPASGN